MPARPAPKMPKRIARLPRDSVGRPIPAFVADIDGVPDFRVADADHLQRCIDGACWVCGEKRTGPTSVFTIGPMCSVNRISSEPPSHRECAVYSALACPFLTQPGKLRRDDNYPEAAVKPGGVMIDRNPGATLLWVTRRWWSTDDGSGGTLFNIGEPIRAMWFAEGRAATRAEVMASLDSGLPILHQYVRNGSDLVALSSAFDQAKALAPA